MGFLDVLKSVGHIVPVVGPVIDAMDGYGKSSSSSDPSTASAVGQTAGSIEQQRMNALINQAKLQQEQDALALQRTNAGVNVGNLNLNQQKEALAAPGQLAGQSVRGDILANSQDASFSGLNPKIHVPTMSGGLRPSMLSASTRALGGQMSRNALADSTSGKYTTQAPLPTVPGATPLPEANAYDKILQGTATGAGFLDALKGIGNGASNPNSGQIPGDVTDAESQLPAPADPGMDPDLAEWFQSMQDGVG